MGNTISGLKNSSCGLRELLQRRPGGDGTGQTPGAAAEGGAQAPVPLQRLPTRTGPTRAGSRPPRVSLGSDAEAARRVQQTPQGGGEDAVGPVADGDRRVATLPAAAGRGRPALGATIAGDAGEPVLTRAGPSGAALPPPTDLSPSSAATAPDRLPRIWSARRTQSPPRTLHTEEDFIWKSDIDDSRSELSRIGTTGGSLESIGSTDIDLRNLSPEQREDLRGLDSAIADAGQEIQDLMRLRPQAPNLRSHWEAAVTVRRRLARTAIRQWEGEKVEAARQGREPAAALRKQASEANRRYESAQAALADLRRQFPLKELQGELDMLHLRRQELLQHAARAAVSPSPAGSRGEESEPAQARQASAPGEREARLKGKQRAAE